MPDQRYDAARQSIGSLLSTTSPRIEVPEWQRSYSWATQQVETFWRDLLDFSDLYPGENIVGEEYFLGSIVLVVGGPTNLLLDGQQRLATSTILLSVLRDARREHKADAATRLQNKYVSDFDDQSNTTTHLELPERGHRRRCVGCRRGDGRRRWRGTRTASRGADGLTPRSGLTVSRA